MRDVTPLIEGQPSLPSTLQRRLTPGLYLMTCARNTLIDKKLPKEVKMLTLMPTIPVKQNSRRKMSLKLRQLFFYCLYVFMTFVLSH
jgi:hypothetical protein